MSVNLTYTVAKVIEMAMSKIGVDYSGTEVKNVEHAHDNLNMLIGLWAADPDLAIARMMPLTGYTSLSDVVDVPLEYVTALMLNLAVFISPDYDQKVDAALQSAADNALNTLRILNVRRIGGSIPTNRI